MSKRQASWRAVTAFLCFGILLWGPLANADGESETLLDLRLEVVEGGSQQLLENGRVILERQDDPETKPLVLAAKTRQSVDLPTPSRWQIRFEIPGLWGQRQFLDVSGSARPAWIFNLRPAGRVSGRLTARALSLPKQIGFSSELPSGARAETACPLAATGTFECSLPVGRQNLVLTADAFAPVRFRSQVVAFGKTLQLAATELSPGASLVGQVVARDGTAIGSEPPAEARVYRFATTPPNRTSDSRPLATQRLGADGSFSFVGLEPGTVILEVTKAGFSPLRMYPLELPPGTEIALPDPLELTRPIEVVVEVRPGTDPFGLPWQLSLERRVPIASTGDGADLAEAKTNPEGHCSFPNQSTGPATLRIKDSAGNTFYKDSALWIEEGSEAWIPVVLPLIEVRGEVIFADSPVAGTLYFGGRNGARRIELTSDEEGHFTGVLPQAGTWPVEIRAEGISTRTRVTVEPRLAKSWAEVTIRLPDTLLFGRVVDETGQPAGNVSVVVNSEGWSYDLRTDLDGSFEARALPVGAVEVVAEQRLPGRAFLTSDTLAVELHEEQAAGPFVLPLHALEPVSGRVFRSGNRPVAGAVVGVHSRGGSFYSERTVTDPEGVFTLKGDPKASAWTVTVMAPGATLLVFQRANDGSPLDISVVEQGGELKIGLPVSSDQMFAENLRLTLTRDGVEVGLPWLIDWLRALGSPFKSGPDVRSIVVPRLAPGAYSACLDATASERDGVEIETVRSPGSSCQSGQLSAGGHLELDLAMP